MLKLRSYNILCLNLITYKKNCKYKCVDSKLDGGLRSKRRKRDGKDAGDLWTQIRCKCHPKDRKSYSDCKHIASVFFSGANI